MYWINQEHPMMYAGEEKMLLPSLRTAIELPVSASWYWYVLQEQETLGE